jgi:hypothetical protein
MTWAEPSIDVHLRNIVLAKEGAFGGNAGLKMAWPKMATNSL